MANKKLILAFGLIAISTIALAQGRFTKDKLGIGVRDWSFFAPGVNGRTGISLPEQGAIALDTSTSPAIFYGNVGTASSPNWQSLEALAPTNQTTRSVISTDTATASDGLLYLSGASFIETLPSCTTAAGNAGKIIELVHVDTNLAHQYTIDTQGSCLIGGTSGVSSGNYVLQTYGESLTLISDGMNWQIVSHVTSSPPTAYTPTFTGIGTLGSSNVMWQRQGKNMILTGYFTTGTTSGTNFSMTLPGSFTVDSTFSTIGSSDLYMVGSCWGTLAGSITRTLLTLAGQSTINASLTGNASYSPIRAQAANVVLNNSEVETINAVIPISGWQP